MHGCRRRRHSPTNDGFWHLVPKPGSANIVATLSQAPSLSQLHDRILGAQLDSELYELLMAQDSRESLRMTLITTYFSPSVQAWFFAQTESAKNDQAEYKQGNIKTTSNLPEELPPGWSLEEVEGIPAYQKSIEILNLSVRPHNALRRTGIVR